MGEVRIADEIVDAYKAAYAQRLDDCIGGRAIFKGVDASREATRFALEAALSAALSGMAEPVAWRHRLTKNDGTTSEWIVTEEEQSGKWWSDDSPIEGFEQQPLFATPPASDLREEIEYLQMVKDKSDAEVSLYVRDAEAEIERLRKALESAVKAIKPLSDAVYNDNADMTVILPVVSYEQCITAYFAAKEACAALLEGK